VFGIVLLACGCGSSKPEVPSWFRGDGKKGGNVVVKNQPNQLHADLKRKMQQLESKQAALEKVIASVNKSKADIVERLHKRGIDSAEDLSKAPFKDDDEVQRLKTALIHNRQEYARYQRIKKEYDGAMLDAKLALEQLDRQLQLAQAGITDKELEDLNVALKKLDERLNAPNNDNPVDMIKGDKILEKEF
jgi:hypothetical protein